MLASPSVTHAALTPGTLYSPPPSFGRFRLLHQVGAGVLGPVFRTHDPEADRLVAVKAFSLDITPEQAEELSSELQRLVDLDLDHPHIAQAVATGLEAGVAYLAQQYVTGESLDAAIRQYGPAPAADATRLMTHVAEALDAAARVGIFHGALHPRDLLVTPADTHLTGLGVSKALERIGQHGPIRRPYAAPERESGGEWGAAADVFSLAVVAYEVLTGNRPLPGTDEPLPGLSELRVADLAAIRELFESAFDPDPDRRPAMAADFALAFAAALAASTTMPDAGDRTAGRRQRARPRAPKLPGLDDPLLPSEPLAPGVTPADPGDWAPGSPSVVDKAPVRGDESLAAAPVPPEPAPTEPPRRQRPASSPTPSVSALGAAGPVESEGLGIGPAPANESAPAVPIAPGDVQLARTPRPESLRFAGFASGVESAPVAPPPAAMVPPAASRPSQPREDESDLELARDPGLLTSEPLVPRAIDPGSSQSSRPSRRLAETAQPALRNRRVALVAIGAAAGLLLGLAGGYYLGSRPTAPAPVASGPANPAPPLSRPPAAAATVAAPVGSVSAPPPARSPVAAALVGAGPVAPSPRPTAAVKPQPAPAAAAKPSTTSPTKTAATPTTPVPSSAKGRITVRSTPTGADVFVDGQRRGVTPRNIRDLAAGEHTIRISRAGSVPVQRVVTISRAKPSAVIAVTLRRIPPADVVRPATPAPASAPPAPVVAATVISIESRPPAARVLLDGKDVGVTPIAITHVVPGAHTVELRLAGFRPWSASVTVAKGERKRLTASLERNPTR